MRPATLFVALFAAWAAAQGKTPGEDNQVYKNPGTDLDKGGYVADGMNGTNGTMTKPPKNGDGNAPPPPPPTTTTIAGGDRPDRDGDGRGRPPDQYGDDGRGRPDDDYNGDGRGRPDQYGNGRARPAPGGAGSSAPTLLAVLGAAGLAALAV